VWLLLKLEKMLRDDLRIWSKSGWVEAMVTKTADKDGTKDRYVVEVRVSPIFYEPTYQVGEFNPDTVLRAVFVCSLRDHRFNSTVETDGEDIAAGWGPSSRDDVLDLGDGKYNLDVSLSSIFLLSLKLGSASHSKAIKVVFAIS
jgi:hypothetical protein